MKKFLLGLMFVGLFCCGAVALTPPAPVINIITYPAENTEVTEGKISGSLFVLADVGATDFTLAYQWYSTTVNSVHSDGLLIQGATNANFDIPTTLTVDGSPYYYYCVVKAFYPNSQLRESIIPSVSTVTVNPPSDGGSSGCYGGGYGALSLLLIGLGLLGIKRER